MSNEIRIDPAGAALPPEPEMWKAFVDRDASYEGVFFTAVRTTGIFCRPTCSARPPRRENVEFYATAREALAEDYRPCRRCRPLEPRGTPPEWLRGVLEALDRDPDRRFSDADLRAEGLDPGRVRRWFKTHHGMTFHAYQRARRIGRALDELNDGGEILAAGYRTGYESASGFHDAVLRLAGRPPGRARGSTVVRLARVTTPLGPMVAGATGKALHLLEFDEPDKLAGQVERLHDRLDGVVVPGENAITERVAGELAAYFAGTLREFTVPTDPRGTDFQESVWQGLRSIPYGSTVSYGEQARAIGRPRAVRAVARANGANPIAIVLPCHRVIGADGTLTGYGGGLWRKRRLLELEGSQLGMDPLLQSRDSRSVDRL